MLNLIKPPKIPKQGTLASLADRHKYYQIAVQAVDAEIDFVDENYRRIRGQAAKTLREDFCGTANSSCEWIRRRKSNAAISVDLDQEVLDWGHKHNVSKLNENQRSRIQMVKDDVRSVTHLKTDIVLAMNFSYQIFITRVGLRKYFASIKEGLNEGGVLFIDAYGGHESYREIKEKTKCKGFTYYWDQARYDPISGHMLCYIHFKFPDGSKLKRAFAYFWRLYTLPELQEILSEAGFKNVTVYWEGTDTETNEGNGEYSPATVGVDDPAWIVYISAEK